MAPHLTAKEKDFLRALLGKGLSLVQIHAKFVARRARSRTDALALNNLRLVLKGETYRQGLCETRRAEAQAHTQSSQETQQDPQGAHQKGNQRGGGSIGTTLSGSPACKRSTQPQQLALFGGFCQACSGALRAKSRRCRSNTRQSASLFVQNGSLYLPHISPRQ